MNAGLATLIVVLTAMVLAAGLVGTWMNTRARSRGEEVVGPAVQGVIRENEALKRCVRRLGDRLSVLERIATDPAERTTREIEKLR